MTDKKIHDIYYREGSLEDWLTAATYLHVGELICYSKGPDQSSIRFFHDTGKELSESLKTKSVGVDSVFIIGRDASQHACDGVFRSSWQCAVTNVRHWCVNVVEAPESPDKLNNIRSLDSNDMIMSLPYAVYMTHEYDSNIDNISGIPAILRAFEAYTKFNFNMTDTLNHTYAEIVNLLPNLYSCFLPNEIFVQCLFDYYDAKLLKKWMQGIIKLMEDDQIDTLNAQMKEFVSGKKSNAPKQEFMYNNINVAGQSPTKRYDELIPLAEGKIVAEKIARDVLDNARSVNNGVRNMFMRAADMLHEAHQECYMPSSAELELVGQDSDSGDCVESEDTCQASEETEKPDNDSIAELKIEDLASPPILEKLTAWAKGICPFDEDNPSGYFILDDDNLDDYDKLNQICDITFLEINLPQLNICMGELGWATYKFKDVAVIIHGKDAPFIPINQPLDYARYHYSDVNVAIDICENADGNYVVTFDINAHAFNFDTVVKFCEGLEGQCESELTRKAREFLSLFYLGYPYRVTLVHNPIVISTGPLGYILSPIMFRSIPVSGTNLRLGIFQDTGKVNIYLEMRDENKESSLLPIEDMRKMPPKPVGWVENIDAIPDTIPIEQRIRKLTLIFPQFAMVDGDDGLITFRIPDICVVDLSDMDEKIPMQLLYDYVRDKIPKNENLGGIIRITKSSGTDCYRHASLFSEDNDDWGIQCQSSVLSKDKEALVAIKKYFSASETARRSGFLLTKKIFDAFSPARNYVAKTVYLSTGLSLKISVDVTGDIAFVRFVSGTFTRD